MYHRSIVQLDRRAVYVLRSLQVVVNVAVPLISVSDSIGMHENCSEFVVLIPPTFHPL